MTAWSLYLAMFISFCAYTNMYSYRSIGFIWSKVNTALKISCLMNKYEINTIVKIIIHSNSELQLCTYSIIQHWQQPACSWTVEQYVQYKTPTGRKYSFGEKNNQSDLGARSLLHLGKQYKHQMQIFLSQDSHTWHTLIYLILHTYCRN